MRCIVCEASTGREHLAREMMQGGREEFLYWECASCGCVQNVSVPENLGAYYSNYYTAVPQPLRGWEKVAFRAYAAFPRLLNSIRPMSAHFASVMRAEPRPGARILDVGCGSGRLVLVLRSLGFDAHGIDAFADESCPWVRKQLLDATEGGWDLIMFHHSLEHIREQEATLRCAREKLAAGGGCLARIPLATWAWSHYGTNWVQLDAPRHFVLHTMESFRRVVESAGLRIESVTFDSSEFQFIGSECLQRGLAWNTSGKELFSRGELKNFKRRAAELNRRQLGDQAAFHLKP